MRYLTDFSRTWLYQGIVLPLAIWGCIGAALAGPVPQGFGPLVTARQVAAFGDQVRVIDLRETDADPGYADGHVPGAVSAPYSDWRGPAVNPGALLPVPDYTALVRRLGVTRATPVVLVSAGDSPSDFGAPARVYWTLKWLGVEHVAILNGGMAAWALAKLPVQRVVIHATPSAFTPALDDQVLATRAQVAADLSAPAGSVRLLDARPTAFFDGLVKAPAARQPGTLPGAVAFNNLRWFPDGGGALPDRDTLLRIARAVPAAPEAQGTVSFCNTGHWAATNWFVLSQLLGQRNVRLYPGSMVDWSRADEPMAHVPTRWEQLKQQWSETWRAL